MKKRMVCLLLAFLLAGLSGCASSGKPGGESGKAASETAAVSENEITQKEALGKSTASKNAAEAALPVSEIPLYACEAFTLQLVTYHDFVSGRDVLAFDVIPLEEESFSLSVSDILLNGKLRVQDDMLFYLRGEEAVEDCSKISEALALAGEKLSRLSFMLTGGCLSESVPLEVEIPEEFAAGLVCLPFMDAKAERQVLIDDENCMAELICCGLIRGYNEAYLSGILYVENRSENSMPADINGMMINGSSFKPYADKNWIAPGEKAYVFFREYGKDIAEAGITSVSSVSIQLLTDREEMTQNTGFSSGGRWYPLTLSVSGLPEEEEEAEGEIVYEDEEVKVFLLGKEASMSTIAGRENRFLWVLDIVYTGEETVDLVAADVFVDGRALKEVEDTAVCILDSSQMAPSSKMRTQLVLLSFMEEQPEVEFTLRILRQGKSRLIREGEERIVLK